jgi:hypothetical protein
MSKVLEDQLKAAEQGMEEMIDTINNAVDTLRTTTGMMYLSSETVNLSTLIRRATLVKESANALKELDGALAILHNWYTLKLETLIDLREESH